MVPDRGTEVGDAIHHVKPDTKVLYISGYTRPVLASKGILAPDVHLIEKPFTASAIFQKPANFSTTPDQW
ncbi:hypothetical protein ACWKSP_24260 [Micromonosporaceae bacterium Da 78-11]